MYVYFELKKSELIILKNMDNYMFPYHTSYAVSIPLPYGLDILIANLNM